METLTRVGRACALLTLVGLIAGSTGCRQLRGRKLIQDGTELYKKGKYPEAVVLFERAGQLVPEMPLLWLNLGYTCRQLIAPGAAPAPDTRRWTTCALDAFNRLRQIAPADPRGDQLYVQTLFDSHDYATLEGIFVAQNRAAESRGTVDLDAATGLQQVYFKQGRWAQALSWARKAADARASDADAQYRLGAFIWQLLSTHGGGVEVSAYDPRPRAAALAAAAESAARGHRRGKKPTGTGAGTGADSPPLPPGPPALAPDDISGGLRIDLADEGIRYLDKALALRPRHADAMVYMNLLYKQKSFALFDEPAQWQAAVDQSGDWQKRSVDARNHGAARP